MDYAQHSVNLLKYLLIIMGKKNINIIEKESGRQDPNQMKEVNISCNETNRYQYLKGTLSSTSFYWQKGKLEI